MTLALWLLLFVCLVAAYTDVTTRRIPNALVVLLAAGGIGLHAMDGLAPVIGACGILAAVILVGTYIHALGFVGGGDIKLFAAAAATIVPSDVIPFLLYTTVAGGVVAIAYSAVYHRVGTTFANVRAISMTMAAGVRPGPLPKTSGTMPYALAILAGAALLASAHSFAPFLRISL